MKNERENSVLIGDSSFFKNKSLNETIMSHLTKGSGEKDYKELASLISRELDDKANVSISSNSKFHNKSNSILSNIDWNGNTSRDDSKHFYENFNEIKHHSSKPLVNKKKIHSQKPKNLFIFTSNSNKTKFSKTTPIRINENYNEDLDENIESPGNPNHLVPKWESNKNNLNEITKESNEKDDKNINDVNKTNNSVTTTRIHVNQEAAGINNNNKPKIPLKPNSTKNRCASIVNPSDYNSFLIKSIPEEINLNENNNNYTRYSSDNHITKKIDWDSNSNRNSIHIEKNVSNFINKKNDDLFRETMKSPFNPFPINPLSISLEDINSNQMQINPNASAIKESIHAKFIKNISTRNSTESNESIQEGFVNNLNMKKYYTPTHNNTLINNKYNLGQVQRELDFNSTYGSNNSSLNPATASNMNKMSLNPFIPAYNNFMINYSQTPQNALKSFSFVNSNFPNAFVPIATNNLIPFEFAKAPINNNINNKINNHISDVKFIPKDDHQNDFRINLENIISGKDKRTTIMLRNIPNKYTLSNLVEEINQVYLGKIDYINLPIDYERKLNLGYSFINFVDPLHIVSFYDHYVSKKWLKYRSDKKIDLNYAEKQGKKDINNKDENTYFACEDKKLTAKKLIPKIEMPYKFLDQFKKAHPNAICIVENKTLTSEKTFYVKFPSKN